MKKKVLRAMAVLSAATLLTVGLYGCTGNKPTSEPVSYTAPVTSEILTPDEPEPVSEADYLAFVNGEAKIKAVKDLMFALENGTEYSLEEFRNAINEGYEIVFQPGFMSVTEIDYAIIDCGNDGIPEMALQVTGNTAEQDNEIQDYYIVKKLNGELCVVDQYESFYRSFGELNKYGVFCLSGSGGASLSYVSYERINAEGEHEFIYSEETEYAMADTVIYGIELPSDADLPEGYPQLADSTGNGEIIRDKFSFAPTELTFVDGSPEYDAYLRQLAYVFHDQNGNVIYPNSEYSEIYSDLGIVVTDDAGSKQMISDRIASLGISEEEMYMLHSTPDSVPDWKVAWDGLEPQPLE